VTTLVVNAAPPRDRGGDQRLVCIECGHESLPDAKGWRVYLTDDDETATYYPECAAREFGA